MKIVAFLVALNKRVMLILSTRNKTTSESKMKISNLIKALTKAGCTTTLVRHRSCDQLRAGGYEIEEGNIWHYISENASTKMKCDWYSDRDGEVFSVQVMGMHQSNDSMTDYFPGIWCDTIKRTVHIMTRV